ncbi:MAG: exodeoxyribonuclease V subunit gamma [Alcanivoracaceae bacterium]|nr:exodeoxyribonuclease V subunit gamma [Alcanivoracaceae bacterium]
MQSGLAVIHANHLETLTDLTVQWLQDNPLMPLEDEIFLVQSNGMAQWLKLKLASDEACGISAAQRFQMPARFLWAAYRSVLGEQAVPPTSPFDKSRLIWRLMGLLPTLLERPSFHPLRQFLADDADQRKRFQLAERLADLFDQYQVYRADWLALWEQDQRSLITPRGDRAPLPEDQHWQAELWQALIADLADEQKLTSRAHVHQAFMAALENGAIPQGLPRRLVVFGITSLPSQVLDALHALSPHCQILMLVQNPCQHYWADIIEDKALLRLNQNRHQHKASMAVPGDDELPRHGHPLLAAWGKQARDYIGLLYDYDVPERYRDWFNQIDLFYPVADHHKAPHSLLATVQQSILDLEPLPDQSVPIELDQSIQFHCSHSPQREVEILHDQLLAAFAASVESSEPLRPRDIIVMVPDIETYAPHIDAVFGTAPDAQKIPYTISDRSQRHRMPFAIALEALLNLPRCRFTVSDLLDLLDVAPLRQRFAIAEADLPTLRRWVHESGIRWGLHARQRGSLDLPDGFSQNSWTFGIKRMLLGYLGGGDISWQNIQPYAEVAGLQAKLAGQLYELLSKLEKYWQLLSQPGTPEQWLQRLHELLDDLFILQEDQDLQLQAALLEALADWQDACGEAGFTETLPLSVAREAWLGALDQGGLSQRFLAGRVNFCTLMPMRSIPFRRVCLLGMNDGDYPRAQMPLDFDLMAGRGHYRPGDRSRRDDDRYLFLEALLASREALYISWVGRDVRDNHERPPSVLVAQLRDYLASAFTTEQGKLIEQITVIHPLQPFSPKYFDERNPALFSYDQEWRAAHDQISHSDQQVLPLPDNTDAIHLNASQLSRFIKSPPQLFFNERLKVRFAGEDSSAQEDEPFALDGLDKHQIETTLLSAVMQAAVHDQESAFSQARRQLLRSGSLPVGHAGEILVDNLGEQAWQALSCWQEYCSRFSQLSKLEEVYIELAVNQQLFIVEDWLNDLRTDESGQRARLNVVAGALKDKPHRLLNDWALHLLANAAGLAVDSVIIGSDQLVTLTAMDAARANEYLTELLDGWLAGLCEPLPLACRTGFAFVAAEQAQATGTSKSNPLNKARDAYQGNNYGNNSARGEVSYGNHQALRRAFPDFTALTTAQHGEEPAFCHWARRLYGPLLAHSEVAGHE